MTVYYVRNDGSDLNTGTLSNTAGAWETLTKALGASGISGGDTLYIAPGVYRETIEVGFASTGSTTYVYYSIRGGVIFIKSVRCCIPCVGVFCFGMSNLTQ